MSRDGPKPAEKRSAGRVKRIAIVVIATGLGVLALTAVVNQNTILEIWYLHRLEKADADETLDLIEALGRIGSAHCVPELVRRLSEPDESTGVATRSLGVLCPRVARRTQGEIVDALLARIQSGDTAALDAMIELAPTTPSSWPRVANSLREFVENGGLASATPGIPMPILMGGTSGLGGQVSNTAIQVLFDSNGQMVLLPSYPNSCAAILLGVWPDSRSTIRDLLSGDSWPATEAFLRALPPSLNDDSERTTTLAKHSAEALRHFAREHADARVRAFSTARAVAFPESGSIRHDLAFLAEIFELEEDLVARRALIRLASLLGNRPGNLDLASILFRAREDELIVDAIRGRTAIVHPPPGMFSVRLLDEPAVHCDWLIGQSSVPGEWTETEIEALRAILEHRREPELRDAASTALAERFRPSATTANTAPPASELASEPQLEIHEWGVWKEEKGALSPTHPQLADLPAFVQRSQIRDEDLRVLRNSPPSLRPVFLQNTTITYKPVVFFYAARPLELYVHVGFRGGRAWTFYPEASDYSDHGWIPGVNAAPGGLAPWQWGAGSGTGAGGGTGAGSGTGESPSRYNPPWIPGLRGELSLGFDLSHPARLEHERRFRIAPWIGRSPSIILRNGRAFAGFWGTTGLGTGGLTNTPGSASHYGLSLEWSGLRVGHAAKVEAPPPRVEDDHWWNHLRAVPSSRVALRGGTESFLFYDGPISLPPIVRTNRTGEVLALKVRPRGRGEPPIDDRDVRVALDAWRYDEVTNPEGGLDPQVFVVRVDEDAKVHGDFTGTLSATDAERRVDLDALGLRGERVIERFLSVLVERGLTRPEAVSLVKTWETEFFESPGLRVLTIIPPWLYDACLPLTVRPAPKKVVRVGVIWTEL